MGKQKNDQPAAGVDGSDPAGTAGGTETVATAADAGTVSAKPADAVSAATPAGGDQPAVDVAATDTGGAVAGVAVAAGSKEAEKEVGDGKEAQTPADGEPAGTAQGQRDPDGKSGNAGAVGDGPITVFDDAAAALAASSVGFSVLGNQPAGDDGIGSQAADEFRVDAAWLARECAGLSRLYGYDNGPIDLTLEGFTAEEAAIMADFVRDNPEAPLLAMYKHLELTLRLAQTQPNNADMLALSLFRHACLAAFEYERCEAAERAAAEFNALPVVSWGGATALDPIQPALQPTGFRPL